MPVELSRFHALEGDDTLHRIRAYVLTHPLATVVIAASLFRFIAVIWSKGFIHSDDYYDTVAIAHDWLRTGVFGPDGFMHWKDQPGIASGRFPLYALVLFGIMKVYTWFGVHGLDTMMYGVRFVHALISMIPVLVTFAVVKRVTRDDRWAVVGGLVAALHFAMPFLGVRCLIETVGGELWMGAIYGFYRYADSRRLGWLWFAAAMTGLAWMIRFQIAFAVLPIPFILWYEDRGLRGAIHYSIAVGLMILLAWLTDWVLMGRFASTTLTHLHINIDLDALYSTIPAMYLVILLAVFIPPLSIVLFWFAIQPSFMKQHRILVISFLSFFIWHWLLKNQQERFIFPMVPACVLIVVLALWHRQQVRGYLLKSARLFRTLAVFAIGINLILLVFLSGAYAHRGLIEPVVQIDRETANARVLFLQPDMRPWIPYDYASTGVRGDFIKSWAELDSLNARPTDERKFEYFVIYPKGEATLAVCVDSLSTVYGEILSWRQVEPSWYDWLLHRMNPRHNDTFEAYIYRPAGDRPR